METLPRLTGVALDRVRTALRDYDVKRALVAVDDRSWKEHLLAVTPGGLAIVTLRRTRDPRELEFAVRVARWPQVRLGGSNGLVADDDSCDDLAVRVGRATFVAVMEGSTGQRTLRDFVVAAQRAMRGEYAYLDYDAASMLTT